MKISCLFFVLLAVVSPLTFARNLNQDAGVADLDEEPHHIQPRFLSWITNKINGTSEAASEDDETTDDETSIANKVGNAAKKAASKLVNNAVTSALGANGAETLSNIKEGLESGDKKKVVGAVADAALNVAFGSSGAAMAKTGIGAAGQGVKVMGGFVGGAVSKIGGDSAIGDLGDSIKNRTSKVGSEMTEYAGGLNATKANATKLAGYVAGMVITANLGPIGGAVAKTGIGAAGKILQTGGGLVGDKLSEIGGNSTLGKLGNVIESGSNVVGETMTYVGGTDNKFAGALGDVGTVVTGHALQTTGNLVGGALTKVAGDNESLVKLGQTIQSESQDVGESMIDIGKSDFKTALGITTNVTAAAA